jgi:hypothetical protein
MEGGHTKSILAALMCLLEVVGGKAWKRVRSEGGAQAVLGGDGGCESARIRGRAAV